ncbi:membrane protein [Nitratireductor basaltis]|uniref:ZIP Zinc transporter n=1 Tax=Nitratireductor basaltis TaxID=472175 RepID=A0A084U7M1_9HYPH|nr:membrane protein [Nitratireductor basaltis]KFB08957.1 ZIP Zinc transporter [Nitratireductor basaltis]
MTEATILTFACALAFAATHYLVPKLHFLSAVPRSRWLSLSGGVAVAYVFMHLLPELAEHERALAKEGHPSEILVYALAMSGLAVFYGLEQYVQTAKRSESRIESEAFWIHLGAFALYNVLIGYFLLHREEVGIASLAMYFVAMALHFVTNDFGMHQQHRSLYDNKGRWVLALAVLSGWLLGQLVELPEIWLIATFSFLAGSVVLNVLKEELPEERQSSFLAFAGGLALYATLLAAL